MMEFDLKMLRRINRIPAIRYTMKHPIDCKAWTKKSLTCKVSEFFEKLRTVMRNCMMYLQNSGFLDQLTALVVTRCLG